MLKYNKNLKYKARNLRSNMTESEQLLWSKIRRKQILGVQFNRQKPVGNYIVDFYAASAKLVIEVDGSQHMDAEKMMSDKKRTEFLESQSLQVLRFDNRQVLAEIDSVLDVIYQIVKGAL